MASTLRWHGTSFRELPTSVVSTLLATSGLNVVIGAAPVHLVDDPARTINRPILVNNLAEATALLGYSSDWISYPLCEHMDSALRMFRIRPVVYINVLNPARHRGVLAPLTITMVDGVARTNRNDILSANLVVAEPPDGTVVYVLGSDYLLTRDENFNLNVVRVASGAIPAPNSPVRLSGFVITPTGATGVTAADIIGGINIATGQEEGIEAVERVFPETGLIPGILYTPAWSDNPEVAAILASKADDINGCFKCRCIIDVADSVTQVIDVLAWKTTNNIVDPRQDCCFPYIHLGERRYHLGSQWGPLQMHTDATRGRNVPYWSPSNKPLKCNGSFLADGTELPLSMFQANDLNRIGVCTALRWGIYGWKGWGNRTAAGGGASNDYKDIWIPQKRMNDFIGNTFVLTFQNNVDDPGNRRLIDLVVDSFNAWLAGLYSSGAILGGRVEFRHEDNPRDDIMDGIYRFWVATLTPSPAEWIEALLEVDVNYFDTLFQAAA